jgi:hypothetical protein
LVGRPRCRVQAGRAQRLFGIDATRTMTLTPSRSRGRAPRAMALPPARGAERRKAHLNVTPCGVASLGAGCSPSGAPPRRFPVAGTALFVRGSVRAQVPSAAAGPSANLSRGVVVPPGGSPAPPGPCACETQVAGAAPAPPSNASGDALDRAGLGYNTQGMRSCQAGRGWVEPKAKPIAAHADQ